MTVQIVIIASACLFGVYHFFRIRDLLVRIILASLIAGMAIGFAFGNLQWLAMFLIFLGLVFASAYGIATEQFSIQKRILISLPPALVVLLFAPVWLQLPIVRHLGLLMIVPVATYVVVLLNAKDFRDEVGFITIITSLAGSVFITYAEAAPRPCNSTPCNFGVGTQGLYIAKLTFSMNVVGTVKLIRQ